MRILNWNTEFVSPRARTGKFELIRKKIAGYNADVICLTEAYPETMPNGGHLLRSKASGRVNAEARGARKALLWSRNEWSDVDSIGSTDLPEGRFISGTTVVDGVRWRFVGMCIPYFGYRANKKFWGEDAMRPWQGAERYLECLASDILTQERYKRGAILLGDYNLQIPPGKTSRQPKAVSQRCEATFYGWNIVTAGELDDPALDKRFIDHVAVARDIRPTSIQFFSRYHADGACLSDHNGVCIDVKFNDQT